MTHRYDDMIGLPHHVSRNRPQQPMEKRAAQFAPFAALTGYDEAVTETARYTDAKQELEDEDKAKINSALLSLMQKLKEQPMIHIEYFVPDSHKQGGTYVSVDVTVKKIDEYSKRLTLSNGKAVAFDNIRTLRETRPEQ